jgi:hypothetical protein
MFVQFPAFVDRLFLVLALVVATTTVALPRVTGYGTLLFQLVAFTAWGLIKKATSGMFADQHHGLLWAVALLVNVFVFSLIALPIWASLRRRRGFLGSTLLVLWTGFYVASLFWLFPATDGP